ncbi:MAG: efflux transporter periplasmic adaptor subunit, partial [Humidesulfovibrio sp.]|nr:efflux transporter periplasmic adaptor subunit [Humidesulfovibrio sp.]
VPNQALKWVGGGQTVFVVDKAAPGGVRAVAPKLGLPGLEQSEVLEGLQEGDVVATQIVLSGNEKPAESAPVPDKAAGPKPGKPGQSGKKGG